MRFGAEGGTFGTARGYASLAGGRRRIQSLHMGGDFIDLQGFTLTKAGTGLFVLVGTTVTDGNITFDIDGLDPVFCIGTGVPEPGGLSMRDAGILDGVDRLVTVAALVGAGDDVLTLVALVAMYSMVLFPSRVLALYEFVARRIAPKLEARGRTALVAIASVRSASSASSRRR